MRLIDADALIKDNGLESATKYGNRTEKQRTASYSTMMLYEIAEMIDEAPTVDAEPVRHGRWIFADDGYCRCSECNQKAPSIEDEVTMTDFCPHCGQRLDWRASEREDKNNASNN